MKKIFKVIIILLIFFITYKILIFNMTDDSNSYTRIMMHEMYESKDNIEIAFLGASHVYRGFNPDLMDKITDKESFNLGSSNQLPEDSYFLLKEFLCYNQPEVVFFEISYNLLSTEIDYSITGHYLISDYFKPGINKYYYIFSVFENENYLEAIFPVIRYKRNIFDLNNILKVKTNPTYLNYDYVKSTNEQYMGKGFVYSYQINENNNVDPDKWIWKEDEVDLRQIGYIKKIIELCQDNNIRIILVTAPIDSANLLQQTDYGEIHDYFTDIANEYEIEYLDFNYIKKNKVEITNEDMQNNAHLNGQGAEKITSLTAEIYMKIYNGSFQYTEYFEEDFIK